MIPAPRIARLQVLLAITAVVALWACTTQPAPPPNISSAHYARPAPSETGDSGRIAASAGYAFGYDGPQSFVGEGSALFQLHDHYDLVVSTRLDATTVEGNLRLLRGPLEVGWTHGGGGSVTFADLSLDSYIYHISTGLNFQIGGGLDSQFFGALRLARADGSSQYRSMWYVMGSLGYRIAVADNLALAPELHAISSSEGDLLIAPTIAVSAGF